MDDETMRSDPNLRVLLVDDSTDLREILTTILNAAGDFTVVGEAWDAPGAVDGARTHQPDVVILDVRLGSTSGLQAIGAIRDVAPQTRVIVLSASPERRDEALALGAAGFLDKSFTRGMSFIERLRMVLEASRASSDAG